MMKLKTILIFVAFIVLNVSPQHKNLIADDHPCTYIQKLHSGTEYHSNKSDSKDKSGCPYLNRMKSECPVLKNGEIKTQKDECPYLKKKQLNENGKDKKPVLNEHKV